MPKDQGYLGVVHLATHNTTTSMKHLYKFLNSADLPWVDLIWESYYSHRPVCRRLMVSFRWKKILKLLSEFEGLLDARLARETLFFSSMTVSKDSF